MEKQYYIGMDLGGTNIKVSCFDRDMNKIAEQRIRTEVQGGSEHVLERMKQAVLLVTDGNNLKRKDVVCMGIGVPGLMDIEKGISTFSPNFPRWENVEIVKYMQDNLHIPTFIDNDARVNLYGEWNKGAGKGRNNMIIVTLGTGLGSSVLIDGNVIYGSTNSAGELGHINMYREGRPCKCGSSGCFGRYVSALGMINTLKEKLADGQQSIIEEWVAGDLDKIKASMISKAYDTGDQTAIETMHETGELLGIGLLSVISLYNPELIVIGGGMSNAGERLLRKTREVMDERALKIPWQNCEIVTAELGDAAGMIGAAIYGRQRIEKQ